MRLSYIPHALICFLFAVTIPCNASPVSEMPKSTPKKILMFTSKGGYGHMAACATLKKVLPEYDITIVNPFETTLQSLDVVKKITWGKYDCEEFYNSLLQNSWIRFMNFFCHRPAFYLIKRSRKKIERKLYELLQQEKPDLLLSTIPLINYPASCAAQRSNIPFLLVTLDADLTKWLLDLEKITHPNFVLTVGTNTPLISKQLAKKHIAPSSVREIGCPLREDFFEYKNRSAILHDWQLPSNKPIAMLIRGGAGSNKLIEYVKTILKFDEPLHLLVCVGRNEILAQKLNRLRLRKSMVTFSIIPFTTRISDLMSVTDILITQPTPNTCNEAMHFGIPILVDKSSPTLFWEDATLDLIALHGTGAVFKYMRNLNPLIKKYLGQKCSRPLSSQPLFSDSIRSIVHEMLYKDDSTSEC